MKLPDSLVQALEQVTRSSYKRVAFKLCQLYFQGSQVPGVAGPASWQAYKNGRVRPTLNPLRHVLESYLCPKSVDDRCDGKATILQWIKAFCSILGQKMRLGTEELLGPGGTLLDKFKDLGNIVERINRQQLEVLKAHKSMPGLDIEES